VTQESRTRRTEPAAQRGLSVVLAADSYDLTERDLELVVGGDSDPTDPTP